MVESAVRKTGHVPNLAFEFTSDFAIYLLFTDLKLKYNSENSNLFKKILFLVWRFEVIGVFLSEIRVA